MKFPLIGPTYSTRSIMGDCERAINWFPELVESGLGKSKMIFYDVPGMANGITLGDGVAAVVATYATSDGQLLALSGATLYSIDSAGVATSRGTTGGCTIDSIVSISDNTKHIVVSVDGRVYRCTIAGTDFLTLVTDGGFSSLADLQFSDGYIIAREPGTNKIWISGLYDAEVWNALDFSTSDSATGNILSFIVDHRELWIQKENSTEAWGNSGNPDFPFQRIPGAYLERGTGAPASLMKLDNCLYWIGRDKDGSGMVFRSQGYQANRISNHGIEFMLQSCARLSETRAWSYMKDGHTFYCLHTPGAETTLCYDISTNMWHERGRWNTSKSAYEPCRAWSHAYAHGKHWVGDRLSGVVYELSADAYSYGDETMRRLRRTPHLYADNEWLYYKELKIDIETGAGLSSGQGSDPIIMIRYSSDGGKTWGLWRTCSLGKTGQYTRDIRLLKMGRARDRVIEFTVTDPVPVRVIAGYIKAEAGLP